MNVAVVGLSHKTAPVDVREKLSIPEAQVEQAIAHLLTYPHLEEVAILSTCNRLEIYVVISEAQPGVREIFQFLADHSKIPLTLLRQHLFVLLHHDAVMHLMRVASGLDSLVLGEGQILAQVKLAHKLGQQYKGISRVLNQLFKDAVSAGKRVRTETSIGAGAVSISSAAVEMAQIKVAAPLSLDREHTHSSGVVPPTLGDCRIAILGAGKMSRLLVQHLLAKGATRISILNRSIGRAEELIAQFSHSIPGNGNSPLKVHPFTDMMTVISQSDIVFTSTAATEPLLNREKLSSVMNPCHRLMIFDISVPRNVDSDVNDLPTIQSYNVDDLKAVVAQNHETRRQMAMEGELLLEEAVLTFEAWWRSLETIPIISSLQEKVETIRTQELEKALSRLGSEFAEKHQDVIEQLTRGIVKKILHDPMVQLRAQQDIEARRRAMESLRILFNLETGSSGHRQFS